MKVILLDDVPALGHEGDVVEVADGHLRNYLEPRKLAVRASKGALKDLEARRLAIQRRDQHKRDEAQELAEGLREQKIVVHAQTGEGTKLHGSVTSQQIADAASEQLGFELDRRDIDIPEPIRETGHYLVTARVYKDVDTQLAVSVIPIEAEEAEAAEPVQTPEAEPVEAAEAEAATDEEPPSSPAERLRSGPKAAEQEPTESEEIEDAAEAAEGEPDEDEEADA